MGKIPKKMLRNKIPVIVGAVFRITPNKITVIIIITTIGNNIIIETTVIQTVIIKALCKAGRTFRKCSNKKCGH
jgi:hypothetical protein